MKTIPISKDWLKALLLQKNRRHDQLGTFSTNSRGDVWDFETYGRTPLTRRRNLKGTSPFLDELVREYLRVRPIGGRFFFDAVGAYYKDCGRKIKFCNLDPMAILDTTSARGGKKSSP